MTANTHNLFAVACLMTAAVHFPPQEISWVELVVILVANIVGAYLPDLDQASSRLWDLLPGGNIVGKIFRKLFLQHRTLTHSFLGIYLVYKVNSWIIPQLFNNNNVDSDLVLTSLMIGYLSHLLADGLTEEGLPLLFPLKWKFGFPPIRRMRIKTGKWFEKYIFFPGVLVYIIIFCMLNISIWRQIAGF